MDRRSQGLVGAAHAVAALSRAHRHRSPARRPRSRGHLAHWPQRGTARLARRGRWRRGRARDGRAGERVDRRAPRGGARQRRAHRGPQRHRRASCRALRRARARRGCGCRRRSEGEPARSRRVPRRAGRARVARARCRARRHADDGVVDRRRVSTCRARRRHPRSALCRGSRARRELDTSPQPQAKARDLARAMQAHYLPLPYAGAATLSEAVRSVAHAEPMRSR